MNPEQACNNMGYTLDQLARMLDDGGGFEPALISLVMSMTGSSDQEAVTSMLNSQVRIKLSQIMDYIYW